MRPTSDTAPLQAIRDGAVLRLQLNRPAARNGLDAALISALTAAFAALPPGVRVVQLGGVGPAFCAGADLHHMRRAGALPPADNVRDAAALQAMFAAVAAAPAVVIGRVHGAAFGGGLGLVACCDVALSARDCRFALSEVRLGLVPAVIAPFVAARAGTGALRRFFVTGAPFDAAQAQALHLVDEVVAAAELDAAVDTWTAHALAAAPGAVAAAKALLGRTHSGAVDAPPAAQLAALIAELRAAPEAQEGLAAFAARRPPAWGAP